MNAGLTLLSLFLAAVIPIILILYYRSQRNEDVSQDVSQISKEISSRETLIHKQETDLAQRETLLRAKERDLEEREAVVQDALSALREDLRQQELLSSASNITSEDLREWDRRLTIKAQEIDAEHSKLKAYSTRLTNRSKEISAREKNFPKEVRAFVLNNLRTVVNNRSYLSDTPAFHCLTHPDEQNKKVYSKSMQNLYRTSRIQPPFNITAQIKDPDGEVYKTSLYSCNCAYYQRFHAPCDHMLRLALEAGGLFCFAPGLDPDADLKLPVYLPSEQIIWIASSNPTPEGDNT